jgi:hypothetical protein
MPFAQGALAGSAHARQFAPQVVPLSAHSPSGHWRGVLCKASKREPAIALARAQLCPP